MGGKVLRPAQVTVSDGSLAGESAGSETGENDEPADADELETDGSGE
jgi:hypothetical protein